MDSFLTTRDAVLCLYQDLCTPVDIFRFTDHFSNRERITHIDPRLDSLIPPTQAHFETTVPLHDGTLQKVGTTVLLPAGAKKEDPLPGIVLFYPGANASRTVREFSGGDVVTIPNLLLLQQGYALILPDVPVGPEGTPANPLQEIVDVLLPQVYHAADLGHLDIRRLGLIGQSYGGYSTAGIIAKTNLFRAGVAISGVFDLGGSYGSLNKDGSNFNQQWSEYGQGRMGTPPWSNVLRYLDNSPYYQADKIQTPLLIIHGEKDTCCKVNDAEKLYSALKRLEQDVTLAIYLGQGHVIENWTRPNAIDASKRILSFFDTRVKGNTE